MLRVSQSEITVSFLGTSIIQKVSLILLKVNKIK